MNKLCRLCLSTKKELEELKEDLLDYFQDICYNSSGLLKHMCCANCKDLLKNNMIFRNKCLRANDILQKWIETKTQVKENTETIESLYNALKKSYIRNNTEYANLYKNVKKNIDQYHNINKQDETDLEQDTIKDEMENNYKEIKYEDADVEQNDDQYDQHIFDHESNSDCDVDKSKNVNLKSKIKKKSKHLGNGVKRLYPRKDISEYSQYEEVFEIQLFKTDKDAIKELLSRRDIEPYLSAEFRCEICYTVYKCRKLLDFHMKWHTGTGEFVCDICKMRFTVQKTLLCHKSKCHRGRFSCKFCPLVTYYGSAMKAHFQKHKGKTYKCHCNQVFKHISSYLSHKRTVHASTHVCVTCARSFVSELGLAHHRNRAHKSKSKEDEDGTCCIPCGLTFASQQVYTVHILNTPEHREQAKDIIGCPYCGLSFDDASQLKSHKRLSHSRREDLNDVIKCKLCDAEGIGRIWRYRHYSSTHPLTSYLDEVSDARLVMCERCGKRFTNINQLKDHMNSHLGVKPYTCKRCNATFSSNASLRGHRMRHLSHDTVKVQGPRRRKKIVQEETS